jgi:hypothetical protein
MDVQYLSVKLANDIATVLFQLRAGYIDHIRLCDEAIKQQPPVVIVADGHPAEVSREDHLKYIEELKIFTRSIGFDLPEETI